jgi:peptidoglycan-N-acetylglucosamine deacetylase
MKNWNMKGSLSRKIKVAFALIVVSTIISIGANYKNMGVFRLIHKKVPIYSVDTKEKKISLSFDISWGADTTPKLLDILDKYNVKATFFLVGGWIDNNGELVREMAKRGHELGNHTNKHPDMSKISKERLIEEITTCEAKIMSLTGQGTKLFRCPAGVYNDVVLDAVQGLGRYTIQWDVDSIDWKEHGASIEFNRVMKKTKPGSILLFHNTAKYTPETLPQIIEKLQQQGYSFVKVSDLIYKDNFYIDAAGKQIKK